MDRRARTDAQLIAVATDGDASAFAALVHRHAARVHAVVAEDTDPDARVVEVFTAAMTRLADAPEDVGAWLDSIARAAIEHHHHEPTEPATDAPAGHGDIAPERLDALWRELATRWPSGRAAPRIPTWLPWVTTAAVTIALSAGIPWWLLGPDAPEPDLVELSAFPLVEGPEDPADEPEPVEEKPLPTFEFPVPPEELEPAEEPVEPEPSLPDDEPVPTDGTAEEPTDADAEGDSPDDATDDETDPDADPDPDAGEPATDDGSEEST
ncbi:MAG: hypothetical protein WDZ26_03700 [Nitriliruptoraceae bacterium]